MVNIIEPLESTSNNRYLLRVWCDQEDLPETYVGRWSNALVIRGPAAYQWNDGTLVKLQ